jgi:hypothetical protein
VSPYRFVYWRRTRLATGHDTLMNLGDSRALVQFPVDLESYTRVISTLEDVLWEGVPNATRLRRVKENTTGKLSGQASSRRLLKFCVTMVISVSLYSVVAIIAVAAVFASANATEFPKCKHQVDAIRARTSDCIR